MMVVMPTFSASEQSDDRIVAAVVRRRIASITPNMGDRIDRPRRVPHKHRSQRASPDKKTRPELSRVSGTCARHCGGAKASNKKHHPGQQKELDPVFSPLKHCVERITHDV